MHANDKHTISTLLAVAKSDLHDCATGKVKTSTDLEKEIKQRISDLQEELRALQ